MSKPLTTQLTSSSLPGQIESKSKLDAKKQEQDIQNHENLMTAVIKKDVDNVRKILPIVNPDMINTVNKNGHTLLTMAACIENHSKAQQIIKMILDEGADIDKENKFGHTPLATAAINGYTNVAQILIDNLAFIDQVSSKTGNTALMYAARYNSIPVVECLLRNEASTDIKNHQNETAFDIAKNNFNVDISDIIKTHSKIKQGQKPEHQQEQQEQELKSLKKELKSLQQEYNQDQEVASLMFRAYFELAVRTDSVEDLKGIIFNQFDADQFYNYRDKKGDDALTIAIKNNCVKTFSCLLEQGFNPNTESKTTKYTPLTHAAHQNRFLMIKMLVDKGGNLNHLDYLGSTPLMYAAGRGHKESVLALLECGADPTLINKEGKNAETWARDKGKNEEVAEILAKASKKWQQEKEQKQEDTGFLSVLTQEGQTQPSNGVGSAVSQPLKPENQKSTAI